MVFKQMSEVEIHSATKLHLYPCQTSLGFLKMISQLKNSNICMSSSSSYIKLHGSLTTFLSVIVFTWEFH